jgi:hypothetical protein
MSVHSSNDEHCWNDMESTVRPIRLLTFRDLVKRKRVVKRRPVKKRVVKRGK